MKNKKIDSHVIAGDYFGTLATILDLLRQDVETNGWRRLHEDTLVQLRDDLVYLQGNYTIQGKSRD